MKASCRRKTPSDGRHGREEIKKSEELQRVVHLLKDPLSVPFKERCMLAMKNVTKTYQQGYLLRDLADIFNIINHCAERIKEHPDVHKELISVLCDLLHICRLPFLKEKNSDEVNYATTVMECLAQLGHMIKLPINDIRQQICRSISSFYSYPEARCCDVGLQQVGFSFRLKLLEQSGLVETLLTSSLLLEEKSTVRLQLLQTLQLLSSCSEVNCSLMLRVQGAQKICLNMNRDDPNGQVLFCSVQILWNLLEGVCRLEATGQLSNMDCIMSLKEGFLKVMHGSRLHDQQLRNDLLVLCTLIAENPKAPFIESGFAKLLILFATFPELKSHSPLTRSLKLSFNNEDFEMKKLLLNLVVVMSHDLAALQLFREDRLMLALMLLIRPSRVTSGDHRWTSVQLEELQIRSLSTLTTVAPLMVDDYVNCQASTTLLLLLDGPTVQDINRRDYKRTQIRYCLRLLRAMVSLENIAVNQDLCDQGAIGQMLGLLKPRHKSEYEDDEEDIVSLEIKVDAQLILSILCDNDLHKKELFGCEGVNMTVHFLKMSPMKFYNGLGHNKLMLSTVDCVWSCIVGCFTTEEMFLEKEGIFLLFDQLHSSPRPMQNVVLATLLDLCDNPKTLVHVLAWRGRHSGISAPQLLLLLWRQEESELGVRRDQHGRITDPQKPLTCVYQEQEEEDVGLLPHSAQQPSAAVIDVSENLRAKIYGLFCRLGFQDLPGLTADEYITLSIVSRYFDFKVGEVWEEISCELSAEGVHPVTPDRAILESIIQLKEETARKVAEQQDEIMQRQYAEEEQQEAAVYQQIKSNHAQEELAARSWDHHVAKTSYYTILKDCKKQQARSIESSRPRVKSSSAIFHSTQISGLQTTTFSERVKTVESTPVHLIGGPLANADLAME
ncbi:cilia- and flagella-associated protein 69 [Denticeps clupeoides]|uniref:Cilia- and flagella-associated protein 69 ARM repeats domain-containing protein n=1 Tax=Denticeps clupeoides TaxID=299321 RepID=A0AAY4BUW4_9TELE|nr:cilia- and flagella-associated protein 69 [Denticeps clupeoides]